MQYWIGFKFVLRYTISLVARRTNNSKNKIQKKSNSKNQIPKIQFQKSNSKNQIQKNQIQKNQIQKKKSNSKKSNSKPKYKIYILRKDEVTTIISQYQITKSCD